MNEPGWAKGLLFKQSLVKNLHVAEVCEGAGDKVV